MKEPILEFVDSGIGNRFERNGETVIELNQNLKKYPKLYHAVLNHELGHSDKKFSMHDLRLDLGESRASTLDILIFMIRNPKSFKQLLPLYYSKKWGFVYDLNLIIIYIIMIIILGLAVYFSLLM